MVLVTINGFLSRWPTLRALAGHVHVRLQPQFNEVTNSVMLQSPFGRAEDLGLMLEMTAIESGSQLSQFLVRRFDPFVTALAVSLALLARIEPIQRITPVLGQVGPIKKIKRLGRAGVI